MHDNYPDGDPDGLKIEGQIQEFAEKNIEFAALRITNHTEKMFLALENSYKSKMGRSILFSELGQSTKHFNFFLTQSISHTLTLTSQKGSSTGGKTQQSLVNRLLQLSSEGKFSKIDTFVEKLSSNKSSGTTTVLRHQTDTNKLESIAEDDEHEEEE